MPVYDDPSTPRLHFIKSLRRLLDDLVPHKAVTRIESKLSGQSFPRFRLRWVHLSGLQVGDSNGLPLPTEYFLRLVIRVGR